MIFAQPEMDKVLIGLIPTMPNQAALYIAIGIIELRLCRTIYTCTRPWCKPENLIVPRGNQTSLEIQLHRLDYCLNLAFFVNAAILILAAATFYKVGCMR
jgi:manganese transport protein